MPIMQNLELTQILVSWADISSGSGNLEGLSKMLKILKRDFSSLDGKIEEIPLSPQIRINLNGEKVESPLGKALRIRKRPEAPIQIFFGGHMDTVYPKESLFQTAEIQDEQLLNGPGVADMKGGLLVLLKGLEDFEKNINAEKIGWEILIVPDEEIGSPGSSRLFLEGAARNQIGLLFEPTLADGTLVSARKGSWNGTVVARGKSAHAGREFHEGRNAITALSRFMIKAEELSDPNGEITVNIGTVEGGGATNVVPDFAICRMNIRMKQPHQVKEIRDELETLIKKITKETGVSLELFEDSLRPPKPIDPETEHLFHALAKCALSLEISLEWQETGGACDGNTLAAAGLPTIDTLGVIGGNLHTPEEYMEIASLSQRIKLLTRFLERVASGEITLPKEKP